MNIYRDADADLSLLRERSVAIVGYGNQAHAHALNLRDSGIAELIVALRDGSANVDAARSAGFTVMSPAKAAARADLLMVLAPDETHPDLYERDIAPNLRPGAALGFAHGLAVHFGLLTPRPDLDVFLVAPKGPGRAVRSEYLAGPGLPCLFAVAQDATGNAKPLALAYASAIGCGRSAMIETSFREECETDLFGEQAVLCGGVGALVQAGFETLVEAGYEPEMAYFECVHEVKLIVDLIHARGLAGMRAAISTTAEYGDYVTGPRIVTDATRAAMRAVLGDIRSGDFARALVAEYRAGNPLMRSRRAAAAADPVEAAGVTVRKLANLP
ncbi:MAG: ketol-acid reductoisomerase [Pseudomonadota bacterium]